MEKLPDMGTEIFTVLGPTMQAFTPQLLKNKTSIHSVPRDEFAYGSHPRQKLDVYSTSSSTAPILIFLYGGGLTRGDKIIPPPLVPEPLVYHNVGSFFAQRGYTTIIPDYRRVNTPQTGEDAVFPSGGEDVALVLQWLGKYLAETGSGKRDVLMMGNSAGGVHISTYLLEPRWKEERLKLVGGNDLARLCGAILLSIPSHFDEALESRAEVLKTYYGSVEGYMKLCPLGLLRSLLHGKGNPKELGVPEILAITAELDPVGEIIKPNEDFVELWKKGWESGLEYQVIAKHNHISPPWALGTNDEEGERWGVDLIKWMDGKRSTRNGL